MFLCVYVVKREIAVLMLLQRTLDELGIRLRKDQLTMDTQPLLKLVLTQFFGKASGFVDMCVRCIPSPIDGARAKVIIPSHSVPSSLS